MLFPFHSQPRMASIAPAARPPVEVTPWTRAQLIERGHTALLQAPTLTEIRRMGNRTLHALRGPGIRATIKPEELFTFARVTLGATSTAVDMLRPKELIVRRVIMGNAVCPYELAPAQDSTVARVGCAVHFLLVELAARPPLRSVRFRHPTTGEIRFQVSDDGAFVPYLFLLAYFVVQIQQGQTAFSVHYTYERLFTEADLIRSGAPVVEHAIVIRDGPSAAAPSRPPPPAERRVSLTELSSSLGSLAILITSDPTGTQQRAS
jgi:hypothetical protein